MKVLPLQDGTVVRMLEDQLRCLDASRLHCVFKVFVLAGCIVSFELCVQLVNTDQWMHQ